MSQTIYLVFEIDDGCACQDVLITSFVTETEVEAIKHLIGKMTKYDEKMVLMKVETNTELSFNTHETSEVFDSNKLDTWKSLLEKVNRYEMKEYVDHLEGKVAEFSIVQQEDVLKRKDWEELRAKREEIQKQMYLLDPDSKFQ